MRFIYNLLIYMASPLIFLRLLWKSRRMPVYRQRLAERWGFYPFRLENCIWLHAVSMGEVIASAPIVKALLAQYKDTPLLVTTMTPTGSAQVSALFGDQVKHVYIPYDFPDAVNRFLRTMNPKIAIIMETELWPNKFISCHQKQIPVCVLNARLSEKSARGYQRIAGMTKQVLQSIQYIVAHAQEDADRFVRLGAKEDHVLVSGSVKFDLELPADLKEKSLGLREALGHHRFVWLAASTHEGEEEILLAAHEAILKENPDALLVLVPRHPERFDDVAKLAEKSFVTARRSMAQQDARQSQVYLGDTMGELLLMYAAADVAFVGGSLIPRGGHNLLEPAALGLPLLSGPHLFNFKDISDRLIAAKALSVAADKEAIVRQLKKWMKDQDLKCQAGKRALTVVEANRGALQKQLDVIRRLLP